MQPVSQLSRQEVGLNADESKLPQQPVEPKSDTYIIREERELGEGVALTRRWMAEAEDRD